MLRLTGRLGDGWLPSLGGHYEGESGGWAERELGT